MTIGNRIYLKRPEGKPDLLKEYAQLPAANIADTMNRIAVLGNGIRRISSPQKPAEALRNPQQYAGNKRQAWSFVIY